MKFLPLVFLTVLCGACRSGLGPVVPQTPVQRQMIGLLQKFDRWDDDGDGELDASELKHGINSLKGKPQQVTYTAKDVIDFYDTDHNGKVSLSEAQAGYSRAAEAEKKLQH
jgi:hypothetical protein